MLLAIKTDKLWGLYAAHVTGIKLVIVIVCLNCYALQFNTALKAELCTVVKKIQPIVFRCYF